MSVRVLGWIAFALAVLLAALIAGAQMPPPPCRVVTSPDHPLKPTLEACGCTVLEIQGWALSRNTRLAAVGKLDLVQLVIARRLQAGQQAIRQ